MFDQTVKRPPRELGRIVGADVELRRKFPELRTALRELGGNYLEFEQGFADVIGEERPAMAVFVVTGEK